MKYLLVLMIAVFFFSCAKNQQKEEQKEEFKSLFSVEKEHVSFKTIEPAYEQQVESWEQLKTVTSFLSRFKKASPNDILGNALELESLVKTLKDTVKPVIFKGLSLQTRLNILHNETLRLSDMTFISAISAEEVHEQTNKILKAFSAVNSKINTILQKKQFEDAIKIDVNFIGLDSTKIDSVSKKTIQSHLEERKIDKNIDLKKTKNRNN